MRYLLTIALFSLLALHGAFQFTGDAGFSVDGVPGAFYLLDGLTGKEIGLHGKPSGDSLTLSGEGCRLEITCEPRARLWHFKGKAINTSSSEQRWELGVRLFVTLQKGDMFWGGVDPLPIKDKPILRLGKGAGSYKRDNRPWLAFPVSAVFGGNRAIIAAGRNGAPVSYAAAIIHPKDGKATLAYCIRIVPGAARSLDFSLSAGTVPMRFENEENIVQAHYDAFPEDWHSAFDWENPYIWGAHSYYSAWKAPKPSRELQRRRFANIEWAYTPWKRPGDIFGHEKYWDYQPSAPFVRNFNTLYNGEYFDYDKMRPDEFHKRRKALFDKYGRDFGYCFYLCPAWCEHTLAKQFFPDALKLDLDKSLPRELGRWTTLNHREYAVLPMWSDYGKFLEESLRKVYDQIHPVGFAIDGGGCGVYYRGKATTDPSIPERAWDAKGIFLDESAAVDRMVEYIHSLNKENPPIAWKNGLGKSDYMMLETSIFNPFFRQWMPHMRYMMGQRPVSVHSPGYLFDETIPGWQNMSREQFDAAFSRLADHVVFTDFEYGFTQCYSTRNGNPRSIYSQPELLECMRLGWQALTPVETDAGDRYIYRSRFGRGADTILFYGNPWEEPWTLHFKVDNTALLGGVCLFVRKMRDHATLTQKYQAPDTVFQDTLPSRDPALYEAVIALSQAPDGLGAVVSSRKDLNRILYTIELDNARAFKASITPRRIMRYSPQVLVNGGQPTGTIPARAKITVEYRSKYFDMTFAKLDSFPWLKSRVVLPENPNADERAVAERIDEYFSFLGKKMDGNEGTVRISVRPGKVSRMDIKDGELLFQAENGDDARARLKDLMQAMDRQFPYFVREPYGGRVMNARFDFKNHPLSFRRCFEQEAK